MQRVLLGLIATAALAVPAQGQNFATSGFTASSGLRNFGVSSPPVEIGPGHYLPMQNRGHRRHIHVDDQVMAAGYGYANGYAGGYYDYGDFDGNRSFSPDKWNDWWHDRPDRAFPRWVRDNRNCERIWYSGGGWRC